MPVRRSTLPEGSREGSPDSTKIMGPLDLIKTLPLTHPWMRRGHQAVIKITLCRLLNTMIILGVGTGKFILPCKVILYHQPFWTGSGISHLLDRVPGDVHPSVSSWFFYEDYVTPLARRLFSFVVELMPHVWRGLKRSLFLMIGLTVLLPSVLPLPDLDPIVASFILRTSRP
ncbi:hypothetical protein BS47DRAFT_774928 [Hydnum rufescens UP504]|uniref:Uncharacterized protein n=1 Tax=Hydnum rufescens UP504 TaxID=1448309 RepID=A0A9P6DYG0_9AGAM|nr:hypothetical protein BS47DRAFT_774928 [Hydnum rufescens UP504]